MEAARYIGSNGLRCLVVVGLLAIGSPSQAEVYRCIDSSGATSFTQTPCSPDEESQVALVESVSDPRDNDCDVIRGFAWHVSDAARRDVDSPSVFKRYGGVHQLPSATVTLVNDVYHSVSKGLSSDQATALAVRHCKTGNLGVVDCAGLPRRWVDALGGCARAANFNRTPWFDERKMARTTPSDSATRQSTQRKISPQLREIEKRKKCRETIKARIDYVHSQMRMINSPAGQDRLRERRRELSEALDRC